MIGSKYWKWIGTAVTLACVLAEGSTAGGKPNVVLIVCDDLNDYVTGIPGESGHPQTFAPHIEKLAASGTAFRRAYSNTPVCAPSRASFLTGIYPHTSGNLFWKKWFQNSVLKNSRTLMEHFRANGYHTAGTGKLMHHGKPEEWNEFAHKADYGPFVFDGKKRVAHPSVPEPFRSIGAIDGSYASLDDVPFADDDDPQSGWIQGGWSRLMPLKYHSSKKRGLTPDEQNAAWAVSKIEAFSKQKNSRPFFLGVGFIRPHTPLHVPQKYFDLYPLDTLKMPVIKPNDAEDTRYRHIFNPNHKGLRYYRMLIESYPNKEQAIKHFSQAYLACVTAVDECIGRVVKAIDESPFRDNTIIIVTSDHGWQMGQKDYLFKNSPWEESTRIPLVIRAPGVGTAGGVAEHPVSLIDLYPTLVDLCRLKGDTRKNKNGAALDGHSVRPFLENPAAGKWKGPEGALSMIYIGELNKGYSAAEKNDPANQHWTYRTKGWRYIRYNDGSEELYDHTNDSREWTNLADSPKHAGLKGQLCARMFHLIGPIMKRSTPGAGSK